MEGAYFFSLPVPRICCRVIFTLLNINEMEENDDFDFAEDGLEYDDDSYDFDDDEIDWNDSYEDEENDSLTWDDLEDEPDEEEQ